MDNLLPAGKVGLGPGYRYSNADSLRITIYGKGGHGSTPNSTIDPIVIAARVVVTLQTIVSREVKPGEVAVITVGYIQAGTKNNIIPDHAELGLTVRSYKPEVRKQMLAAIERITKAEANAAGATQEPKIEHYEATDAVYNDPALAQRMQGVLESALGKDNVVVEDPYWSRRIFPTSPPRACRRSTSAWVARTREICGGESGGDDLAFQSFVAVRA